MDSIADIRKINSQAVFAKRTGMIILGGGLVKHHIANANLMVRPDDLLPLLALTWFTPDFLYIIEKTRCVLMLLITILLTTEP